MSRSPTDRRRSVPFACCRFRASRKARSVNRQSAISRGSTTGRRLRLRCDRCPIWRGPPVWAVATSRIARDWSSATWSSSDGNSAPLAATDESGNEEMPREATKAVFAFTGRARTWVGIGEALYRSEPVARAVLDRCSELLRQERGVSLLDVMFGRSGMEHDLNDAAWAEPATYALQCALTAAMGKHRHTSHRRGGAGFRPNCSGAGCRSIRSGRRSAYSCRSWRVERGWDGAGIASRE